MRNATARGVGASRGPWIVFVSAAVLVSSCTTADYFDRADHAVAAALDSGHEAILGGREERVLYPVRAAGPEEEAPDPLDGPPPQEPTDEATRILGLEDALRIAVSSNRDYRTRKETLFLTALALTGVRHDFTPQLASVLDYVFNERDGGAEHLGDLRFDVSQILPFGGSATLNAATGVTDEVGESRNYDSAVSLRIVQPLLRNFGHEITYEPLIQAERNLMYEIRDFELFREDFSIQVARNFYDLVEQKQSIANLELNVDNFVFGTRQAEAFFAVGRTAELDVLRARRSELNARDDLLSSLEAYQDSLDRFKVFLGLPTTANIDVDGEPPPFVPSHYDLESAVAVALVNRLDFLNRREQVEDVERSLHIAENALLPDLDLFFDTRFSSDSSNGFGGSAFGDDSYSVGLSLGIPLDRVDERNSYRSSVISLDRARRDLEEFEDLLVIDIRSSFRELERRVESLEIQEQLIEDQTKNLRIAELRFERGEIANRDVVEANQSLLEAKNSAINEQVNHEIARLRLLRNLGILFIDENGMWKP